MTTTVHIHAQDLDPGLQQACRRLDQMRFAEALWARRLDVWSADAGVRRAIGQRLGWLGALDTIQPEIPRLKAFAEDIRRDGFTDVLLLGMGGSSLGPEVLRQVFGVAPGFPGFRMLDSVDPEAVRVAMDRAGETLFVFASKSGGTIEPNVMAAEAARRVTQAGHAAWGTRFIAITDPDTPLHRRAAEAGFRNVFLNPPDIGGRYSVLSYFGMVPAALMGIDLDALTHAARGMEASCRTTTAARNPGLTLGAFMAAGAAQGRDKLTLVLPDRLEPLGLWIEQLVAESTGKQGTGVVPIAGERDPVWSGDRLAVAVELAGEPPDARRLEAARRAGVPVVAWQVPGVHAIGAEFLLWEVATAAAGFLMGINPFDEPNVQQAKDATRALLEIYRVDRRLPAPEPDAIVGGACLTLSRAAREALAGAPAASFLDVIRPGDYAAVLPYLPPGDPAFHPRLAQLRAGIGARGRCATMLGYGPRYLHSTGQLHKGGADNGVFLVVTATPGEDLAIPGEDYSFGVLEMAQATGDFQSLDRAGRRALHVHLPRRDPALLDRVAETLLA